jgi:hypothetical protein
MKLQSDISPRMCPDGYVCLSEHGLTQVQLVDASSGVDDALLVELRASALDALDGGYIERQSARTPGSASACIGCDGCFDRSSGVLLIVGSGARSNVMLIEILGIEIGTAGTKPPILCRLARLNRPGAMISATVLRTSTRNAHPLH